jgi:hypothetical protein
VRSYYQLVLPSVTGKLRGELVCSIGSISPVDARAALEYSDQTLWVFVVLRLKWFLDHIHDGTVLGDVDKALADDGTEGVACMTTISRYLHLAVSHLSRPLCSKHCLGNRYLIAIICSDPHSIIKDVPPAAVLALVILFFLLFLSRDRPLLCIWIFDQMFRNSELIV